ncbi:hypothetical protein BDF19DRAFT_414386 [Syncephalis fuscata]|nr:hypothetical protein BDF19DRAFT_414386 [Syncephalis fuscata]
MKASATILFVAALAMGAAAQSVGDCYQSCIILDTRCYPHWRRFHTTCCSYCPAAPVVESELVKCMEREKCNGNLACNAKCAGVPNPSPDQANRTNTCTAACDNKNTESYKTCINKCITTIFLVNQNVNTGTGSNSTGNGATGKDGAKNGTSGNNGSYANSPAGYTTFVAAAALFASFLIL